MSALSLLTMPITEHLWTWDRFFQTGRDFEMGTLMVLMLFCLVLILSKQLKRSIDSLLHLHHLAGSALRDHIAPRLGAQAARSSDSVPITDSVADGCRVLLRI